MKLSKVITVLGYTLFACTAAFTAQRSVNAYKTHKLSTNSVLISCNDEREPTIKHFENTTLIVVTCQTVNSPSQLDQKLKDLPALPQ